MKSLALLACLALVIFGGYSVIFSHNMAGIVLIIIGSLSFLVIAPKRKMIAGYNSKSFMNR